MRQPSVGPHAMYGVQRGCSWVEVRVTSCLHLSTLLQAMYPQILLFSATVEFLGALLFASDIRFGAYILISFLIPTTLIMHNFWDFQDNPAVMQGEMAHFMKVCVGGVWIAGIKRLVAGHEFCSQLQRHAALADMLGTAAVHPQPLLRLSKCHACRMCQSLAPWSTSWPQAAGPGTRTGG